MANTLKSFRDGGAGFIDRLDVRVRAIPVPLAICFPICRMEMLYTFLKVSLLHRILHHDDSHDVTLEVANPTIAV